MQLGGAACMPLTGLTLVGLFYKRMHQSCEAVLLLRSWHRHHCKHGLRLKGAWMSAAQRNGWGCFDLEASDGTPSGGL